MIASSASLLTHPWVTRACKGLYENKTFKVLGVEVLGINLPRTTIVRTVDEAIDAGVNEFGNTIGFFGGVFGGGFLLDKLLKSWKIPLHPRADIISQGRVLKSFGLIPPLVAFMMAMPFFRNAFTAKRSGTLDFKDLISKNDSIRKKHSSQSPDAQTQAAIQRYTQIGLSILAGGFALAAAGVLWARFGLFKPKQAFTLAKPFNNPAFQKILKAICLTGKKATEFDDLRAVFYWGIPAYISWMLASRDKFEVKEQFLKMINFIAVYVLTDKVVSKFFDRKTAQHAKTVPGVYDKVGSSLKFSYAKAATLSKTMGSKVQKVIRFENLKLLTGLGMTVSLMAVLPALLNIYLTRQRLERAQAEERLQKEEHMRIVQQRMLALKRRQLVEAMLKAQQANQRLEKFPTPGYARY